MSGISAKDVHELRKQTGAGMMDCKKALAEANGDMEQAADLLRKALGAKATKKADRATNQGWIGHYVHSNGKIGVLVEVACETDFVAKNEKFQDFLKDLSMQIAAMRPLAVNSDELDPDLVEKEREFAREEVKDKPAEMQEKIVEGKIKKWYAEVCLLNQAFVKDDKKTIQDLLTEMIATVGENMSIRRFVRLELGVD